MRYGVRTLNWDICYDEYHCYLDLTYDSGTGYCTGEKVIGSSPGLVEVHFFLKELLLYHLPASVDEAPCCIP